MHFNWMLSEYWSDGRGGNQIWSQRNVRVNEMDKQTWKKKIAELRIRVGSEKERSKITNKRRETRDDERAAPSILLQSRVRHTESISLFDKISSNTLFSSTYVRQVWRTHAPHMRSLPCICFKIRLREVKNNQISTNAAVAKNLRIF